MILLMSGGESFTGIFILVLLVMFGPPLNFLIAGLVLRKKKKETAKICFILSGVYLLIAGGICGSLIGGF